VREIRVVSIQPLSQPHISPFDGDTDRQRAREAVADNLDMACRLLSQAGEAGCDIACYPEDVQGIAHYGYYLDDPDLFTFTIEPFPGPTTERIAEVAQKLRMNVVFGVYERDGDHIYNDAVLIGRGGEVLGRYRKVHLPAVEDWSVTPGGGFPVFEADVGVVGMLICYDLMFPEAARALVLNGAEILFNPTMAYGVQYQCEGNGLMRVQMRAIDNFVPVVVSLCGGGSVIVDSDGSILAQARPGKEDIISATIDLDGTPVDRSHWDVLTGTGDAKARFFQERRPETYGDLTAARPAVLARYREKGKRTISTRDEIRAAYEEIRRRWSPRSTS